VTFEWARRVAAAAQVSEGAAQAVARHRGGHQQTAGLMRHWAAAGMRYGAIKA
jgi:hypothetical protein